MANSKATDGFGTVSKSLLASMIIGWTEGACMTLDMGFTFCKKACQSINACIGGGWKSRRSATLRKAENSSELGLMLEPYSAELRASSSLEDLVALGSWNW